MPVSTECAAALLSFRYSSIILKLGLLTSWLTAYVKVVCSACRLEAPKTVEKVCSFVLSPLSGKTLPRLPTLTGSCRPTHLQSKAAATNGQEVRKK